jgi:hypothetical protein
MKINKFSIQLYSSIFVLLTTFFVVYLTYSPIFFATNDDGIISNLTNGSYSGQVSNELIYSSKIYGSILEFLYQNLPAFQWHGIYILISVFLSCILLMKLVIYNINNSLTFKIGIFLIIWNLYLVFIISPTFTMASLISGFAAVIIFYTNLLNQENQIIVVPLILLLNSFVIRPDGFLAIVYFIVPGIIYLIYRLIKQDKMVIKNIFIFLPSLGVFLFESWQLRILRNSSTEWDNYWQFLNAFHLVHTNPSMLKMHQAIAAFQIPGLKWTNVEATLLQSVSYLDPFIFSGDQMEIAKNHVLDFIGLRGLLNAEIIPTFTRVWEYMNFIIPLFFALLTITLVFIFISRNLKLSGLFVFGLLYTVFFYFYLGAVWRIPPRINIPIIFMLILGTLILYSYLKSQGNRKNLTVTFLSLIFIVIFQLGSTGFIGLTEKLAKRQTDQINISEELNRVDPNGIYLGQIRYGVESYSNAFLTLNKYRSLDLSTGWHTFSPAWNEKVRQLGILDGNPVPLLTNKEGVYWVSDSYTAEVMAMYINDRKLKAKGICLVGNLPNDGKIISFQTTEDKCVR